MSDLPENADLEKKRAMLLHAYAQTFVHSPAGEIVLLDLLREGGILSVSYQAEDPHQTSFNEGRRSMALTILERLRWTEGDLMQLALARNEPIYQPITPDAGSDQPDIDLPGDP
jgi:hypothetical protein